MMISLLYIQNIGKIIYIPNKLFIGVIYASVYRSKYNETIDLGDLIVDNVRNFTGYIEITNEDKETINTVVAVKEKEFEWGYDIKQPIRERNDKNNDEEYYIHPIDYEKGRENWWSTNYMKNEKKQREKILSEYAENEESNRVEKEKREEYNRDIKALREKYGNKQIPRDELNAVYESIYHKGLSWNRSHPY